MDTIVLVMTTYCISDDNIEEYHDAKFLFLIYVFLEYDLFVYDEDKTNSTTSYHLVLFRACSVDSLLAFVNTLLLFYSLFALLLPHRWT